MPNQMTDRIGSHAALLSATEIGLGSILHGMRLPLSGYLLSLNQGFLLSRACLQSRGSTGARALPFQVSSVAALLKSLSPAGKKLTPMLALSAQGLLFSTGTTLLGPGLPGSIAGSVLASAWSFVQPFLLYYLLYGQTLIELAEYYARKARELAEFEPGNLLWVILALMFLKALLAAGLAFAAFLLPERFWKRFEERLTRASARVAPLAPGKVTQGPARDALRDLLKPFFLAPLALTAVFFLFAEASFAATIWALLRPIAAGFLLFYLVRRVDLPALLARARPGSFGFSLHSALHAVVRLRTGDSEK